jgi:cyclic pyranopterin phosphate synthase
MSEELTHLDAEGRARMVDVTAKPDTDRTAVAEGWVLMQQSTLELITADAVAKGNVVAMAEVAGVMGAKQTAALIPLCHPLPLHSIRVIVSPDYERVGLHITATARTTGKTGVEMEALTAVSVAALAVYDMAKAVDRSMTISDVRLVMKTGGTRGDYVHPEAGQQP